MSLQPAERTEVRRASLWLFVLTMSLLAVVWMPAPDQARGLAGYLPLHSAMEVVAIAVAAMVFAISWATQRFHQDSRVLVLGVAFLGVAILDLTHTLSFAGMPDFITPSGAEKAINFWVAARALAALALLWVAFCPDRWAHWLNQCSKFWFLGKVLLGVAAIHYLFLARPDAVPRTFIEGSGLTPLKIGLEYGLIAAYVLAAVGLLAAFARIRRQGTVYLSLASLTMAMSEYFFTLYANVTDVYNLAGHIYKIAAYGFLYRGLFVETIQKPYLDLVSADARQRATLNTLPDLLFEVDREGKYLAVHATDVDKLAAPSDRLVGRNIRDVLPQEAADVCLQAFAEADANGKSRGKRIALKVPEGLKYFELSVAEKPAEAGQARGYLVLSRDVTATVYNERRVQLEALLNGALLDLEQRQEQEPEDQFLQRGAVHATLLTEARQAWVYVLEGAYQPLRLAATTNPSTSDAEHGQVTDHTAKITSALAAQQRKVVRSEETAVADEASNSGPSVAEPGILSVPVIEGAEVTLVLTVGQPAGDPEQAYTDADVQALQVLADNLWANMKQRRQEAVIQRLYEALNQSPYPVVITDVSAQILYVNQAFTDVSGYSAPEVLGRNPRILQSGETPAETYVEMWARLRRGLPWKGEFTNRRRDGKTYTESAHIYPVRDAFGETTHYVAHKEDITQRRAAENRILALSEFDSLTGLLNKKVFDERLADELALAREHDSRVSLLWFDLDNFKAINENMGHAAGDELLVEIGNRLRACMGNQAHLARYSGDTFAAIVPQLGQATVALMVEDALRHIQASFSIEGNLLSVGASVGIAVFPSDAQTPGALTSAAEVAMYRVKKEGRNGLRFFAPDMHAYTQRSLELASGLNSAIERQELHLVYQPQLDLASGCLVGAEALLRWNHPRWGSISPAEFIPIAEETGAIVPIGHWVLQEAARQLLAWETEGLSEVVVAVNVSAVQFAQIGLVKDLTATLATLGVATHRVEVELTEAVALRNPELAVATIQRLHDAGFRVSLDDFGTGYSSMSYLKRYAIDKLKIDQFFIKDLSGNESDKALVLAIVRMARSLQMTTIAEGVETPEQAAYLREAGCDEIQGYWFSRPLDPKAFLAFAKLQPRTKR